jgi:phosphatidylserine/phosphatidylglycerophosphate/cardiolipin synthase-like enzyme
MSHPLRTLGKAALDGLVEALAAGRLGTPLARAALVPHVPKEHLAAVWTALQELERDGMAPRHMARMLALLAEERGAGQRMSDRVELVWSPPELDAVDARDTSVVVQELFRRARTHITIATYALDAREKAEALFGELAQRMDTEPSLVVRVFANIHRTYRDPTPSAVLIREFAKQFREQIWPGQRLPEVYYDPRSLETEPHKRAVLHAKAVVVDGRWTLLSSANFTQAAQQRNIEAGVLLDDPRLAARMTRQFDRFVEAKIFARLA